MEKRAASHGEMNQPTIVNLSSELMDYPVRENKYLGLDLFHVERVRRFARREPARGCQSASFTAPRECTAKGSTNGRLVISGCDLR
jgi:hypothetical protein